MISCPQCHKTAGCTGWSGGHRFIQEYEDLGHDQSPSLMLKEKKWDVEGPEIRSRELLVAVGRQNLPHTEIDGQAGKK